MTKSLKRRQIIAGGAAMVTQGGLNIAKAHDERDAANIQSDKKSIDAIIAKLQKQMEDDREEIKKGEIHIAELQKLGLRTVPVLAWNRRWRSSTCSRRASRGRVS